MSFDHLGVIAELELPSAQKLVLYALGNKACRRCGHAWPGMSYLTKKTGLSDRTITTALRELTYSKLITVHAYSRGGRGRVTEYVVLPTRMELEPAPCPECRERLKTPQPFRGMTETKRRNDFGVSGQGNAIPRNQRHQNPEMVADHTVSNTIQSGATRQADPPASPSGSASPRYPEPPPTNAEDARRRAEDGMRAIIAAGPKPTVDTSTRPYSSPETARAAEEAMRRLTQAVPPKSPHGHARKP